jgi:uncharacterized protein YjbI with pentapeptide repeats
MGDQATNAADAPPPVVQRPIRVLRFRVIPIGGAVVVAITAAVIAWLWAEAGGDHQLRIDAVRTGFTVGFGVGGSFALALAARRQWLQERAQAHQEDLAAINHAHQQRLADASEHDSHERRITELYIKAVDQLGSERAPVRLGGLYALERLAQANPQQRQTVLDVICAYLRMPYTPPLEAQGSNPAQRPARQPTAAETLATSDIEHLRRREELQVRLTAQRVLGAHLRDEQYVGQRQSGTVPSTFWPEIDLVDLTGAYLIDFSLQYCKVPALQLNGATLAGESVFRETICNLALVQGATFTGHTDFRGATFAGDAYFAYSSFQGDVWFHNHYLPGHARIPPAKFAGHASFKGVKFSKSARFNDVTFASSLDFSEISDDEIRYVDLTDAHIDDLDKGVILPTGWTHRAHIIARTLPAS